MMTHAALRERLWGAAAARFADRGWDPSVRPDLAAGLLDATALALHVVWTYQEAWADEVFIGSARMAASVDRLLAQAGYTPAPGIAAGGIQLFVARQGADTVLPPGTEIVGTVRGLPAPVTFATTHALRLRADRNEVAAYLPPVAAGGAGSGGGGRPTSTGAPPLGPASAGTVAGALQGHLQGLGKSDEAARRAAVARQRARVLADLRDQGAASACADSVESLCAELCRLQDAAEQEARMGEGPGPMSESQALLTRQLARLEKSQADAFAALSAVLARGEGESLEAWNARVAAMARFLDALVAGLVQDARDQIAMLEGPAALARLDRAQGRTAGGRPSRGRAPPGTDLVYLVGPGGVSGLEEVHPGDWFVVGDEVVTTDTVGRSTARRTWHEAVRVTRVRRVTPSGRAAPLTEIQFEPPLRRAYDLDATVWCGNVVPVVEGALRRQSAVAVAGRPLLGLAEGALAWRRDPLAPDGRSAPVEVTVDGVPWAWRRDLLGAGPDGAAFAVERVPGGGARVRLGDGVDGAAPRAGAQVEITTRVGGGIGANVAARTLITLAPAHPDVVETYNPFPTGGGSDPEPAATSRQRGPMIVATRDRAVSLDDLRAAALAAAGVTRARVFRRGTARRAEVVVVVAGEGGRAFAETELAALTEHLAARVPPLTAVRVVNRVVVGVRAALTLHVPPGADPITVQRLVRERLGVTPATPPGLLDPARVDLDDDLALSAVYRAVAGVPGLDSVVVTRLWRADQAPGLADRLVASPRELLTWADAPEPCELRWQPSEDLP